MFTSEIDPSPRKYDFQHHATIPEVQLEFYQYLVPWKTSPELKE